jgi:hypothetical protein
MYWNSKDRAVKQRLLEYNKMPSQAILLNPQLLEKYDLVKDYVEQREWIDKKKGEGSSTEHAFALQGLT